jgi:hypothetical protein
MVSTAGISNYYSFSSKQFKFLSTKASVSLTPQQQTDILNGFLEGSELKKFIPDISDCAANTTSVVQAIRQAALDFSKANMTVNDIADGIQMVGVAIQGIANATRSCKNLPDSFRTAITYFGKIFADPANWLKLVSASATRNSIYIMMDLYGLESLISSGKYKDVGNKVGEVFKYIFKVELGMNALALFKTEDKMKIDPTKIIQCGFTIYGVAQKAINVALDIGNHPENLVADLMQIAGFYKEIQASCSGVFGLKIDKFFTQNLVAFTTPNLTAPSITDIISCIKSVVPVAIDIKDAVSAYQKGDTTGMLKALEKAATDGITAGSACYKVIKDL